jgi:hypothetical protein
LGVAVSRNPVVYHGARKHFEGAPKAVDGFAIHVGTVGAARSRLRHTEHAAEAKRLFEIEINPKRVLQLIDIGLWNNASNVAESVANSRPGIKPDMDTHAGACRVADAFGVTPTYADDRPIPRDQWDGYWVSSALAHWSHSLHRLSEDENTKALGHIRGALLSLGYQAIAYVNRFEAKGSVSFAIIDPACITNWREVVGPVKRKKT